MLTGLTPGLLAKAPGSLRDCGDRTRSLPSCSATGAARAPHSLQGSVSELWGVCYRVGGTWNQGGPGCVLLLETTKSH